MMVTAPAGLYGRHKLGEGRYIDRPIVAFSWQVEDEDEYPVGHALEVDSEGLVVGIDGERFDDLFAVGTLDELDRLWARTGDLEALADEHGLDGNWDQLPPDAWH